MSNKNKVLNSDSNQADETDYDIIYKATRFLDRNVRWIKWFGYGVGVIGVIVTARSIRMFTQFVHAKDIPKEFIKKNFHLQGIVKDITKDGVIHVKHVPIATLKWMKYFRPEKMGNLPVKLACVECTDLAYPWLTTTLLSKRVWFKLLHRPENDNLVNCIVTTKKNLWTKIKVNEYLVSAGLATVKPINNVENQTLYKVYMDRLLKAEMKAEKRGKGMWKKPSLKEKLKSSVQEYKDSVTVFIKRIKAWRPWK